MAFSSEQSICNNSSLYPRNSFTLMSIFASKKKAGKEAGFQVTNFVDVLLALSPFGFEPIDFEPYWL